MAFFVKACAYSALTLAFLSNRKLDDKTVQQQITPINGQLDVAGKNEITAAAMPPKPKRNVPASYEAVPAIVG